MPEPCTGYEEWTGLQDEVNFITEHKRHKRAGENPMLNRKAIVTVIIWKIT